MKRVIIILFIISLFVLGGCVESQYLPTKPEEEQKQPQEGIKEISIKGVDKEQEISSDIPVIIIINGVRNTITVKENTPVNQIIINGVDITINLPEGTYPEITDSGVRTKIEYY